MPHEIAGSARFRADELVALITDSRNERHVTLSPSPAGLAVVTDALELHLRSAINDRGSDSAAAEGRLLKLEAQTHGLAAAVIAITEPSVSLAPAVQAVNDGM